MSFPADISLPGSAKYFSFKNTDLVYNSNYDIAWSFLYNISNLSAAQVGISTYLTTLTSAASAIPGHYLCTNSANTQTTVQILSNNTTTAYHPYSVLNIAFDSTGLFALSSSTRGGLGLPSVNTNSLVIRTLDNNVIYNDDLLSTGFSFSGTQVVRCRFSNAQQKLFVDYRTPEVSNFTNLATVDLGFRILNPTNTNNLFVGFAFCSPLSTTVTSTAEMQVYNFHIEGVTNNTTTETITSVELS